MTKQQLKNWRVYIEGGPDGQNHYRTKTFANFQSAKKYGLDLWRKVENEEIKIKDMLNAVTIEKKIKGKWKSYGYIWESDEGFIKN